MTLTAGGRWGYSRYENCTGGSSQTGWREGIASCFDSGGTVPTYNTFRNVDGQRMSWDNKKYWFPEDGAASPSNFARSGIVKSRSVPPGYCRNHNPTGSSCNNIYDHQTGISWGFSTAFGTISGTGYNFGNNGPLYAGSSCKYVACRRRVC